jgi:hypothetical protein
MSLEDIYYISQSFAVIAILASLAFVGIQVRQNTSQSKMAAAEAVHRSFSTWYLDISEREMAPLIVKGLENPNALSAEERWSFYCKWMPFLLSAQDAHTKWMEGDLSDERWRIWDGVAGYFYKAPGCLDLWRNRGYMFSETFQTYAETKIAEEGVIPADSHSWRKATSPETSTDGSSE